MKSEHYNFDAVVDRNGTQATKIEEMTAKFGRHDLLPFWIADMDFPSCPAIVEALRNRLEHPVLGYTTPDNAFWQSIIQWLDKRVDWKVSPDELTFMPGLKKGLSLCINYFTRPGDGVVIQPPVYHSFRSVIEGNGRRVVNNPLINSGNSYAMDFEGLRRVIEDEHPTMMIVCNPHNPIGIQWSAADLARVAEICAEHGVTLISDEIYGDMMLDGCRHIPTVTASDTARRITVTLGAPSKTFNIPGIVSAWAVVCNPELRKPFYQWLSVSEFNAPPLAAMVATRAAYTEGADWLDQVLDYLQANASHACSYINERIAPLRCYMPRAGFAVWIDFRGLGLGKDQLMELLVNSGHLALSEGSTFGEQGTGFMRMNIGVPRSILDTGLERLEQTVRNMGTAATQPAAHKQNIPFVKMHGLGNNFVYVDCMHRNLDNLPELARSMSARHTGMDTDGIIVILPAREGGDCRMRIFNADGTEAQMCGNGIRCVAKYVYDNNIVRKAQMRIETLSGIKTLDVHPGNDGQTDTVTVDMGRPEWTPARVPVAFDGDRMVEQPLAIADGNTVKITAVSMGNPHGVVFVDSFGDGCVENMGPQLEKHSAFPENANIEFVRVDDMHTLSMRAWERGAGETMACGTGACAAAAAAVATGKAQWPLTVRLIGGNLHIDLNAATGHILMTGPAVTLYSGTYFA